MPPPASNTGRNLRLRTVESYAGACGAPAPRVQLGQDMSAMSTPNVAYLASESDSNRAQLPDPRSGIIFSGDAMLEYYTKITIQGPPVGLNSVRIVVLQLYCTTHTVIQFCSFCRNGGTLQVCMECSERAFCQACVLIPPNTSEIFMCPPCFLRNRDEAGILGRKKPYVSYDGSISLTSIFFTYDKTTAIHLFGIKINTRKLSENYLEPSGHFLDPSSRLVHF